MLVCVALWMTLQIILRILRIIMDIMVKWRGRLRRGGEDEKLSSHLEWPNVTDNAYTNLAVHLYLTAQFITIIYIIVD